MEEDEKYYIIKGLKENRAIEIQLQSCSSIEELKEKMKLLDVQEKSKSSKNEVMFPKYPMTRIPHHTNQFAHIQQYGGSNWRNDQSQHPDIITNTRYKVYSPQFPHLLIITRPFLFSVRPYIRETNNFHNDRQFCDRILQLSTPVKEHKTIIRYSDLIKQDNL
ncbi:hypothetical protein TNCV_2239331 [Trichonephila clavipes]|nr:hypothetical protein TNCV_2239331 [Trichonephila clavipes]